MKTEKRKQEPILIPIRETRDTKPKRIIGSVPLFKTESESETDILPPHSKYIQDVLIRKVTHDPKFGVYEDDTDGSFKIGNQVLNILINTCLCIEKSTRQSKVFENY